MTASEPRPEDRETRLKRLRMRSWRRGIREMDLLLGAFSESDAGLRGLDDAMLAEYEELLEENDQELFAWVSNQRPTPAPFEAVITAIKQFHSIDPQGEASS